MPLSPSVSTETSLLQDWIQALRYWLGGRFGLITVMAIVVGGGLWLNWSWLVYLGVAPLILSVLPCAVMCALGLCMHHGRGGAQSKSSDTHDQGDIET